MATVTMVAVERSGPAISAAIAAYAPDDEPLFTAELRPALARAARTWTWPASRRCWHALATWRPTR